jgi:hypothetical protein
VEQCFLSRGLAEGDGALGRCLGTALTGTEWRLAWRRAGVAGDGSGNGFTPCTSTLREMRQHVADRPSGARAGPGPCLWIETSDKVPQLGRLGPDQTNHISHGSGIHIPSVCVAVIVSCRHTNDYNEEVSIEQEMSSHIPHWRYIEDIIGGKHRGYKWAVREKGG